MLDFLLKLFVLIIYPVIAIIATFTFVVFLIVGWLLVPINTQVIVEDNKRRVKFKRFWKRD